LAFSLNKKWLIKWLKFGKLYYTAEKSVVKEKMGVF